MDYSSFIGIALIILTITSFDLFRSKSDTNYLPAIKRYRAFVIALAAFFVTDFLWGIFEHYKLVHALYVDTTFYFIAMGATIFFWTRYIVAFLNDKNIFAKIIEWLGFGFFLTEVVLIILNLCIPNQILFSVTPDCVYTSYSARDGMLWAQIGMYSILTIYSVFLSFFTKGVFQRRHIVMSLFSVIMGVMIGIQLGNPYLPLYSSGCLIGYVLINCFVIGGQKSDYREALMKSRKVELAQREELTNVTHIAYSDPMTGVKNKHAYVEAEEKIDKAISNNEMEDFAIVVFDLNGLKHINDTRGHAAGDAYIIEATKIIKKYFGEDELYRYGGDEFVVILQGDKYKNRVKLLNSFERQNEANLETDKPVISAGMSRYNPHQDNTFNAVFSRADKIMYARKDILKEHRAY